MPRPAECAGDLIPQIGGFGGAAGPWRSGWAPKGRAGKSGRLDQGTFSFFQTTRGKRPSVAPSFPRGGRIGVRRGEDRGSAEQAGSGPPWASRPGHGRAGCRCGHAAARKGHVRPSSFLRVMSKRCGSFQKHPPGRDFGPPLQREHASTCRAVAPGSRRISHPRPVSPRKANPGRWSRPAVHIAQIPSSQRPRRSGSDRRAACQFHRDEHEQPARPYCQIQIVVVSLPPTSSANPRPG